ncbi:O-antigen ligase family protein, partial [Patescibacteria group bacterium]|nr:O-antigen ligase family protein [Patescibacteria group bacterium]
MTYTVLLILIFLLYFLLSRKNLKLALILLVGLLPTYLLRFSIGPIPVTALEIFILIAAVVWVLKRHGLKVNLASLQPWHKPLLLVLAAASFGVVAAPDTLSALGIWKAYFIEPALVFLMMRSQFEKKEDWIWALKALALSGIVVSIFAIWQYATGLGIPEPWDIERRVTGLFDYPNALGLYLAPIIAIGFVLLVRSKHRLDQIFWLITIILGTLAIILAQTEAAYIAVPAGLILTLLVASTRRTIRYRVALEALILFVILLFAIPTIRQKVLLQDYSGQVRIAQWQESIELLLDNPIFG